MNIKRDRFGRYLLPDPETGEERPWTRVTTAAGTLDDKYGLNLWSEAMVAYGIGQRDDLRDLAASADGPEDRAVLDEVAKQAKQAAASSRKANVGTALHQITQKIDRGDVNVRIPEVHRDRIIRYKTAIAQHRLSFRTGMIERVVLVPSLGLAGTMDRGADWPHSDLPVVFDLKTGSIDHSKVAIAQQLAAYARSTHWWDGAGLQQQPIFNRRVALVLWLSATTDDEPKLYAVDIEEGWSLLEQSMDVRNIRSTKGKHLFTEITADALPTIAAKREGALRERVRAIVAAGHKAALLGLWRDDVPTLKQGGLTAAQLDLVESWCNQVEGENR